MANIIWHDLNGNGIQDEGEPIIAGATFDLLSDLDGDGVIGDDEVAVRGHIDENGNYVSDEVDPRADPSAAYKFRFDLPAGYDAFSPRDVGDNSDIDSDGPISGINIAGNEEQLASGFYKFASIGNRVWNDADGDGIQGAGETGRAGVKVEIYSVDENGEPTGLAGTQTTDENGNYQFTGLKPGNYALKFTAPDGTAFSPPYRSVDGGEDSNANPENGMTAVFTLTSGEINDTVDAGITSLTNPDEVTLCEDRSATFNVLDNDPGRAGLKLVGVAHESEALDKTFKDRGGAISFTEDGQVKYMSMTNYYGKDKLVYTYEDANGNRFTETVDVTVNAVSDAPDAAKGTAYHPSGWESIYTGANNREHWVHGYKLSDFGKFKDTADELQQFGPYNQGVPNDADGAKFIRIYGLTTNAGTANVLFDGQPLDFSNGQFYDISIDDINAGKLDLDFFKAFVNYNLKYSWIDSGEVDNEACYDGSTESNMGSVNISTPIALDLNGDGQIGVTGATSSLQKDAGAALGKTVQFDMDADGTLDVIEWFNGSGDGILVDNRDGLAATQMDGSRLFGSDNGVFANGYDKLAGLDVNGDGQVSASELDGLLVWVDNGDAQVQQGELRTLGEVGISSISTQVSVTVDSEGRGHLESTATRADGSQLMTEDVFFASLPAAHELLGGDAGELDALVGVGQASDASASKIAAASATELGDVSQAAELLRKLAAAVEVEAVA